MTSTYAAIACEAKRLYKHYETSHDVFVDREEYIEWMNKALQRCKNERVLLHLKGIGGIGKSSLLNHWVDTHERTIRLDCEQYPEFYQRLNILAKGAILQGVKLQRFDILWQIRQRFVEGVEPVREEGREWAKEVVMAIPFIGSLASIGSAISAVGTKVTPKLKGKYGTVGKWLQETLGKNHLEQLLEILWKDPRRAEFLYLEAFLEDINKRSNLSSPILFLLDHFEYVDDQKARWRYRGKGITETDLWTLFLSKLVSCVGVMASRRAAAKGEMLEIEESELTELDRNSCIEMLELQGVVDNNLQEKIVSVSGGNPFVLDVICDMIRDTKVAVSDIEDLRADTLAEVRLKVWRRLFSEAEGLQNLINRAGLVSYFDERIMRIIAPELTPDSWDRLRRLSFVTMRSDGTFVLHDLAEDLVRAELGKQLTLLGEEVSSSLTRESEEEHDPSLLGIALSVEALYSENEAIQRAKNIIFRLIRRDSAKEALEILRTLSFRTTRGRAEHQGMSGWALQIENRYAEAETALRDAIRGIEELAENDDTNNAVSQGIYLRVLGHILYSTSRFHQGEGEDCFVRAIEIQRQLASTGIEENLKNLAETIASFGSMLGSLDRIDEALPLAQEAVEIYRHSKNQEQLPWALNILASIQVDIAKATKSFQEALDCQREVCAQDPSNPHLKWVLSAISGKLAHNLWHLGQVDEAETLYHEAIKERKELNELDPDIFGIRLYFILLWYQEFLWWTGQVSKVEPVLNDCLQIAEKLAQKEPEVYYLYHADQLFNHARFLIVCGDTSRASSPLSRAEGILRERAKQEEYPYSNTIALAQNIAWISVALYRRTLKLVDAERNLDEVIRTLKAHRNQSSWIEYVLGEALNNLGAFYLSVDKPSKAKNLLEDALSAIRTQQTFVPSLSKHDYALSLGNLAIVHRKTGQPEEARRLFQESLEIFQESIHLMPNKSQYNATLTLNNYSLLLRELGELDEAYSRLSEAISTQKQIAEVEPQFFEPILAISLNNRGILLAEMGKSSDAEESLRESIGIRRRLVNQPSEMYHLGLATSLHNLGILLYKTMELPDAERTLREARGIWEQLLHKAPELLTPRLGRTLYHLQLVLRDDQSGEAEAEGIEKLLSRMSLDFPDVENLWIEEEEPLHIW
ncbi:MAG: tetratricopeptide repeat protein [Candidatus Thorarchaeota archaeon]|nr:tetratricopeptide repeat protein [Candidatus Thorarchaeota archaeon]